MRTMRTESEEVFDLVPGILFYRNSMATGTIISTQFGINLIV